VKRKDRSHSSPSELELSGMADSEFKREISGPCKRAAKISLREGKQKSFRLREAEFE
jgi:hypothetical protein